MQTSQLLFTSPWWMTFFAATAGVVMLWFGLRGQARPGYLVGVVAMGLVAGQSFTAYTRFDERGVSGRVMFIESKLAWSEIASAEVVHRRGKYSPTDTLELKAADGDREVSLVLNDVDRTRGAALADMLARKLPPALATHARAVADKTAH